MSSSGAQGDGRRYRVGLDIGGTFTDFALQNVDTDELVLWKHPTTPSDPTVGVLAGLSELVEATKTPLGDVIQVVHGTTIGANIVIEKKGACTALLTTAGFRDVLIIQRQLRHSPFDLLLEKHAPLVPRDLVFPVDERLLYDGSVHAPLNEDEVRGAVKRMLEFGVESVAVMFLHAHVNPAHERRAAEILREEAPEISVSLSSEVAPIIREYERASTTVVNAYIRPAFEKYLARLQNELEARGFRGSFYVMQANGMVSTVQATVRLPVRAVESGPAAGVMMAAALGKLVGEENLCAFDVGGTTAKACIVQNGQPRIAASFEIDQTLMRAGTGLPLSIPSIDVLEIGAGGGSIATVNLGVVQVGPESAGADPGPASYAQGGDRATLTDANVVLGYLDPDYYLGGRMSLDAEAASRAIMRDVAEPLGLDLSDAAWAVHEAATVSLEYALRAVSIERGIDPRGLVFVAFGGAGPIHAARLARNLGVGRVIFPIGAGVASAMGLLEADPGLELFRTMIVPVADSSSGVLEAAFRELEAEIERLLDETGMHGRRKFSRTLEMRYVGQGDVIDVRIPTERDMHSVSVLEHDFGRRYATLYGYSDDESAIEITGVRASAWIDTPALNLPREHTHPHTAEPKSWRPAYFPELGGFTDCPVFSRSDLAAGGCVRGPAVVEEQEATSLLLPGDVAIVDPHRNLIVTVGCQESEESQ